ncbi:cation-transporting P-type ATPase, partial [Streptomyces sp. SAS_269]|uniref:cation-transporting P-type ATPase n=1 Tax=Streptomyces sp. SAS_269 TaxID=3412749 RepID=UPI00403C17DE
MVTTTLPGRPVTAGRVASAATRTPAEVLGELEATGDGLSSDEAARRLKRWGPNAVHSHRVRAWLVLWHQLRSPLLGLLLAAATVSYFVGERSDALIIGVIVALSVGLGF